MGATARSKQRSPFAKAIPRAERRTAGRTWAPKTPLALRTSGLEIDDDLRDYIYGRLGLRLGKFAPRVERLTVRFEDVNGPRGGRDVRCGIKVVMSGLPSVVVSELAGSALEAFARADGRVERAVRRAVQRGRELGQLNRLPRAEAAGRGGAEAARKRARPARASASAVGRNFTRRPRKATAALEGSAEARPSRKSTRGSANRAKQGNKLARREQRRVASPKAKRARASRKH